jgi:hypothetical protein
MAVVLSGKDARDANVLILFSSMHQAHKTGLV